MHTLYMIYDDNGKVTDFVIDNVSTVQNFISLDRGPLSYVQSVIDNLNAYIKKNGSLTVESAYISQIRHGTFDQTYGAIEDKRIENPNYVFKTNATTDEPSNSQPVAKPDNPTAIAPERQTSTPETNSSSDSKTDDSSKDAAKNASTTPATKDTSTTTTTPATPSK